MAVMITIDNQGQTQAGYEGMLAVLADVARSAPGFILHTSHASAGGWRVIEVWKSKADADRFFAQQVAPRLPPGVRPKRALQELHNVISDGPAAGESNA
jgi:quinol monooxygenase YgiN